MTVLLFALAAVCGAWADGYRSVFVTLADGSVTQINLQEDLQTDFSPTEISFTGNGVEVVFERAKVASFTFSPTVGVRSLETAGDAAPVMVSGRRGLSLSNLPAGSKVAVIAADGRKVTERTVSGDCRIELADLPVGAYIVSINGMSYKFVVKK